MSKHTPGPWTVRPALGVGEYKISEDEGLTENCEETKANARLIAACPEMLLALKAVHKNCNESVCWVCNTIAKAEGKE